MKVPNLNTPNYNQILKNYVNIPRQCKVRIPSSDHVDKKEHIPLPRHPANAINKPPQNGLSPPGFNDSVI